MHLNLGDHLAERLRSCAAGVNATGVNAAGVVGDGSIYHA